MKLKILFFLFFLLSSCSNGLISKTNRWYYTETESGFSATEKQEWEKKALKKEKELTKQKKLSRKDVIELARYYEYSGFLGRSLLLYKKYEKQQKSDNKQLSEAIMHNIAISYQKLEEWDLALVYFKKIYDRFSTLDPLKEIIKIHLKNNNQKEAQKYYKIYQEQGGKEEMNNIKL